MFDPFLSMASPEKSTVVNSNETAQIHMTLISNHNHIEYGEQQFMLLYLTHVLSTVWLSPLRVSHVSNWQPQVQFLGWLKYAENKHRSAQCWTSFIRPSAMGRFWPTRKICCNNIHSFFKIRTTHMKVHKVSYNASDGTQKVGCNLTVAMQVYLSVFIYFIFAGHNVVCTCNCYLLQSCCRCIHAHNISLWGDDPVIGLALLQYFNWKQTHSVCKGKPYLMISWLSIRKV